MGLSEANWEIPKLISLTGIWLFPPCVKVRNRNAQVQLLKNNCLFLE